MKTRRLAHAVVGLACVVLGTTPARGQDFTELAPAVPTPASETQARQQTTQAAAVDAVAHTAPATQTPPWWAVLGHYSGPLLLGAVALGALGAGIYALMPATCQQLGADHTTCLRGDQPVPQLGIPLLVGGILFGVLAGLWAWLLEQHVETTAVSTGVPI